MRSLSSSRSPVAGAVFGRRGRLVLAAIAASSALMGCGGGNNQTGSGGSGGGPAAPLHCQVAIVGGGPGGVHTAYKLTTLNLVQGPVCLFEKRDHLGGRVGDNFDVGFSGSPYMNGGVPILGTGQTGTGGYRMYNTQYTYKLGQELMALGKPGQLSFLPQNNFSSLSAVANQGYNAAYSATAYFTYNTGDVAQAFEPLYNATVSDADVWNALLCGPQVPVDSNNLPLYEKMNIPGLGSMTTQGYLEWVAANVLAQGKGTQVAQYVLDVWRFRADFQNQNDAVSYLQYNAKDYTGGPVYYPIPSFQPYFDIMADQISQHGGQIFLKDTVLSVNTQSSGPRYLLSTTGHASVTADNVIIAVPTTALDPSKPTSVTGDVIAHITAQPQFSYALGANAVTLTHQFGDGHHPNTGFWHTGVDYPTGPTLLGPQLGATSDPLRRTTNNLKVPGDKLPGCKDPSCDFSGKTFYNNTNELPLTDYHDYINVSRSVYNDDTQAVNDWIALYDAGEALSPGGGGNAAVTAQAIKSLRLMYPMIFTGDPAAEPQVLATQFTVHQPAWYNLKQGALAAGVDNASLFTWSLQPLAGEKVYLVGDSWRNDVSGWSDAAYKGSVYVLNMYFGAKIDPAEPGTIKCVGGMITTP